jgi:hypothetical protein
MDDQHATVSGQLHQVARGHKHGVINVHFNSTFGLTGKPIPWQAKVKSQRRIARLSFPCDAKTAASYVADRVRYIVSLVFAEFASASWLTKA